MHTLSRQGRPEKTTGPSGICDILNLISFPIKNTFQPLTEERRPASVVVLKNGSDFDATYATEGIHFKKS